MIKRATYLSFVTFLFISCGRESGMEDPNYADPFVNEMMGNDTVDQEEEELTELIEPTEPSAIERYLIDNGLVNIKEHIPELAIDLRYSTENNFLGKDVYEDLDKCYLQPDVTEKLKNAQQLLGDKMPGYHFLVFDGVRPRGIQWIMWNSVDIPLDERPKYLSNPKYGSLHNFGAAVDLTIADGNGDPLDMGTEYDYFGELAHPEKEKELLASGELTNLQVNNRKLLREVMRKSGFFNIQTEWWHFNSCYRKEAKERYAILEWNEKDQEQYSGKTTTYESIDDAVDEIVSQEIEQADETPEEMDEENSSVSKATPKNGIVYKVQVKTSDRPLGVTSLDGRQIEEYEHGGLYKYTTGSFNNIEDALSLMRKLRAEGIDGAFVVKFKDGVRI